MTTLADALDTVALSGGGFAEWDAAYEAFSERMQAVGRLRRWAKHAFADHDGHPPPSERVSRT